MVSEKTCEKLYINMLIKIKEKVYNYEKRILPSSFTLSDKISI